MIFLFSQVSSCTCQVSKSMKLAQPPLQHIKAYEPFDLVGMDLIGTATLFAVYVGQVTYHFTEHIINFPLYSYQQNEMPIRCYSLQYCNVNIWFLFLNGMLNMTRHSVARQIFTMTTHYEIT